MRKFFILFLAFLLCPSFVRAGTPAVSPISTIWKDGKAWFVRPGGKPFLSMGVNAIGDQSYRAPNDDYYNPVKNQYDGNKKAWMKGVFIRLHRWHFNTIGAFSDEALFDKKFPYTVMLYVARGNPWEKVLDSVFTDDFETRTRENAKNAMKYRDDPDLVGYFLDNELPWWGDYGWKAAGQTTLLEKYALIPVDDANKEALKKFLQDHYQDNIDLFDRDWGTPLKGWDELEGPVTLRVRTRAQKALANAWAGVVAERYFSVTTRAVRSVDPNHLILGARFAGEAPWEAVEACARYCDVVSVNHYAKSGNVDRNLLDNFYAKSQKPILITEYSFSAMENQSGDPNTHGADVAVPTQKDRAEHLDRFVRQALDLPYVVGLHWFEWSDESPEGRFDGENADYGLVDIHDKEYTLLTQAHAGLNLEASGLHQKAAGLLPEKFNPPPESGYRKAEPGIKVPEARPILRFDGSAKVYGWGDAAQQGAMKADVAGGVLELNYASGTGWGCGATASPNQPPFSGPGLVDLRGYNFFQFTAFVPIGVEFLVQMGESGSGDPSLTSFTGLNGADGEAYEFPSFFGTGKWETYRVDLSDLDRRTSWGNQHGNNILDLQSLSDVGFYIHGNQGSGKMLVKDLEFRVK